jgi:ABC-type lipoprotein export system ATPase subunit
LIVPAVVVEIENVSKSYGAPGGGDAVEIFRDLNLRVAESERIALLGPSGSGKSTLLNIIGALDKPDAGKVRVAGRDLTALAANELATFRNETVGFVFQLHHLLPQCTVLENVLVPVLARKDRDMEAARGRAVQLLKQVGLSDRLKHRPGELSGGERQRVAVARALINQPKILLADEPTGALDRVSATQLIDLLSNLNRDAGVTLLVVSHAREVADRMGRVVEFVDGKLVERS